MVPAVGPRLSRAVMNIKYQPDRSLHLEGLAFPAPPSPLYHGLTYWTLPTSPIGQETRRDCKVQVTVPSTRHGSQGWNKKKGSDIVVLGGG